MSSQILFSADASCPRYLRSRKERRGGACIPRPFETYSTTSKLLETSRFFGNVWLPLRIFWPTLVVIYAVSTNFFSYQNRVNFSSILFSHEISIFVSLVSPDTQTFCELEGDTTRRR